MASILFVLAALFVPQMKGARTLVLQYGVLWIGAVLPILTEITNQLQLFDWTEYVSPKAAPLILLVLSVIQIILRKQTEAPPKTVPQALMDTVKNDDRTI